MESSRGGHKGIHDAHWHSDKCSPHGTGKLAALPDGSEKGAGAASSGRDKGHHVSQLVNRSH